jgi:hypothetical protein
MNLPFAAWLHTRVLDEVVVMFHEVALAWNEQTTFRHRILSAAQLAMAAMVLARADRVLVSTSTWLNRLASLTRRLPPAQWMPIPSNIPEDVVATGHAVRANLPQAVGGFLCGHLGTYGSPIRASLRRLVPALLEGTPACEVLLLGRGARAFREELARELGISSKLHAREELSADDLAEHIAACDVMLQPYPDGITARRTSATAVLALGRPLITHAGRDTEPCWRTGTLNTATDSVQATAAPVWLADDLDGMLTGTRALLAQPAEREALAARGRAFYTAHLSLARAVECLREGETS